jgi:hypothetical protein
MPSSDCPEYVAWKDNKNTQSPWSKIDNMSLSLLRKTLAPLPSNRINIEHIKKHRWMLRVHSSGNYTHFLIFFLSFYLRAPCMKEKQVLEDVLTSSTHLVRYCVTLSLILYKTQATSTFLGVWQ